MRVARIAVVVFVVFVVFAFGLACADPPRIPPVTYEPITSANGAPLSTSPSGSAVAPSSSPSSSAQTTPAASEPATPAAPTKSAPTKPGKAGGKVPTSLDPTPSAELPKPAGSSDTPVIGEDSCLRKYPDGCCGKTPFPGKRSGGRLICPKDMIPPASCRVAAICNR